MLRRLFGVELEEVGDDFGFGRVGRKTDGVVNFVGTDTEESERNHVVLLRQALIDMPK